MNKFPHSPSGGRLRHLGRKKLARPTGEHHEPGLGARVATAAGATTRLLLRTLLMLMLPVAFIGATSSNALAAAGGSALYPGETLYDGQSLVNGQYTMSMQTDGNFVLYAGTRALWQSGTYGRGGAWVSMQTDGNLVVYNSANQSLWQSGTAGHAGSRLEVQSDANAVVYTSLNQSLWQSGTAGQGSPPPSGIDYTRRTAALRWEQSHAGTSRYNGWCEAAVENAYGPLLASSEAPGSTTTRSGTQVRSKGIRTLLPGHSCSLMVTVPLGT